MFNSIDETSSSLTDPIMLRNDRGRVWDDTDENFLSKQNNGEWFHSSSRIEHENMVVILDPCPRKMDLSPFSTSFPYYWMHLNPKILNTRTSLYLKGWLFHLKCGVELIPVFQVRRLIKVTCSLAKKTV